MRLPCTAVALNLCVSVCAVRSLQAVAHICLHAQQMLHACERLNVREHVRAACVCTPTVPHMHP